MSETASAYTYQAPLFPNMGSGAIIRASDGAFIPLELGNTDYQAFLAWVAEGNAAPEGWTGPKNE